MSANNVKAGRAYVEVAADNSPLQRTLRAGLTQLTDFGNKVRGIGAGITKSLGGISGALAGIGGAAIGGGLLASVKSFSDAGSALDDMSARTGVSVEALSELGYAAKLSDTSMESLGSGLSKMQKTLVEATSGSATAQEAFASLGLSADKLKHMSPEDQFKEIADGISNISDPAERAAAAMGIFGKGGVDLLPMLMEGKDGLSELGAEAQKLGLVMSGEDASSAATFGDSMDKLTSSLGAAYNKIGAALAPSLTVLVDGFTNAVSVVSKWLSENKATIAVLGTMAAGIGGIISVIGGLGAAFSVAAPIIGGVVAAFGSMAALLTPLIVPALAVGAAIGGITIAMSAMGVTWSDVLSSISSLWSQFTSFIGIDAFTTSFVDGFKWMFEGAKEYFGAIGQALSSGNLEGAVNVAMAGLTRAFRGGFNVAYEYYLDFQEVLLGSWDWLKTRLSQGFINAWYGIESVFAETLATLFKGWNLFTTSIMVGWHNAIGFIKKAWVRLKGIFDKDVNVDAEVKKIDQETTGKTNQSVDAFSKYQKEVEARRAKAVQDASNNAVGANKILEDERNKRTNDRLNRRNALMSEADAKYNIAKAEYGKAIDAVMAYKPEIKERNPKNVVDPAVEPKSEPPKDIFAGIDDTMKNYESKFQSKGTFSAFTALAGGLKSDSIDKVAQNTANTNVLLKQIANKPGAVFT